MTHLDSPPPPRTDSMESGSEVDAIRIESQGLLFLVPPLAPDADPGPDELSVWHEGEIGPTMPPTPAHGVNNSRYSETSAAADALAARLEAAIVDEGRAYVQACALVPAEMAGCSEILAAYRDERDRRIRKLISLADQLAAVHVALEDLVIVSADTAAGARGPGPADANSLTRTARGPQPSWRLTAVPASPDGQG